MVADYERAISDAIVGEVEPPEDNDNARYMALYNIVTQ